MAKLRQIHPKVAAGTLAAYASTIVITELNRRGITSDGNEAAAIVGILTIFAGYCMPANGADVPVPVPVPAPPPVAARPAAVPPQATAVVQQPSA